MRISRGNYPGASDYAYFDKDVNSMSGETARALLNFILHEAHPGGDEADILFKHLGWAEEKAREQGVCL